MTKGHNQDRSKQTNPQARNKNDVGENRRLTDQDQNKSPDQGRNQRKEQSGGTKGKNAI